MNREQALFASGVPAVIFIVVIVFAKGNVITNASLEPSYPTIKYVDLEPSKVSSGDVMLIRAEVTDKHGIKSVKADMGGLDLVYLELAEGNLYHGEWRAGWMVHGAEPRDYMANITATNILGLESSLAEEWSDPPIQSSSGPLELTAFMPEGQVMLGQYISVTGSVLYEKVPQKGVPVTIRAGDAIFTVETDEFGSFSYKFNLPYTGDYQVSVRAVHAGYATEVSGQTRVVKLEYSTGLVLKTEMEKQSFELGESAVFSGLVSYNDNPLQTFLTVKIDSKEFNVETDAYGRYSFEYVPEKAGKQYVTIQVVKEGKVMVATQSLTVIEVFERKDLSTILKSVSKNPFDIGYRAPMDERLSNAFREKDSVRVIVKERSGALSVRTVTQAQLSEIGENKSVDSIHLDGRVEPLSYLDVINWNQSLNVTGRNRSVCILDTGLNQSLVNYTRGYDFVNNDTVPEDVQGHGTAMTQIISTIAPDSDLYVAKVMGSGFGYESDVLNGLQWCIAQKPDVISFSIGSGAYDGFCDSNLVANMSNQAFSQGILVVAASGNDGNTSLKAPACGSRVFSVGATLENDSIASYSSVNPTLDLFAPSSLGTSYSASQISGASLLVLEKDGLNATELKYRLRSTGAPILYQGDRSTGGASILMSRLDLYGALANKKTIEPYDYSWYWQQEDMDDFYMILSDEECREDCEINFACVEGSCGEEYYDPCEPECSISPCDNIEGAVYCKGIATYCICSGGATTTTTSTTTSTTTTTTTLPNQAPVFGYRLFQEGTDGYAGTDDTYISDGAGVNDTNYENDSSNIYVYFNSLASPGMTNYKYGLVYFNISDISDQSYPTSANMSLYLYNSSGSNTVGTHMITNSWIVNQVTWNNRTSSLLWNSAGGDYNATSMDGFTIGTTLGWYNWSIIDVVRLWVNDSSKNNGTLVKLGTGSFGTFEKYFRDDRNGTYSPKLAVNFTIKNQSWIQGSNNSNINLTKFFYDPESGDLNYTHTFTDGESPTMTVEINNDTGQVKLIPQQDFWGTRTLYFTATDGNNTTNSNEITLNVTPHNCGTYLNSDLTLNYNITGCTGTIIYINASDVTLDCNRSVLQSSGSYGINNTGFDNVTINNCTINMSSVTSEYGIYFADADNGTIRKNNVTVNTDWGIVIDWGCSYNNITENNVTVNNDNSLSGNGLSAASRYNLIMGNKIQAKRYGVYFYYFDRNTLINNTVNVSESYAIIIQSSYYNNITENNASSKNNTLFLNYGNNNNLTGNIITSTQIYDVYLSNSYNNTIQGGSAGRGSGASFTNYYIAEAGSLNGFRDTNFTAARQIYFYDTASWFNYNNQSSDGIWLNTSVSASAKITRELTNWNQTLVQWNDTNTTGTGITATYNVSNLTASSTYYVYNNSVLAHTLKTDSNGFLNFTIFLNGETEIKVQHGNQIYQCDSCSDCNSKITSAIPGDTVKLNTSISDYSGTCITINKNKIIFDCQGYTIDGTGNATDYYGIYIYPLIGITANNSVENCIISDFANGFKISSSLNNTIQNTTVHNRNSQVFSTGMFLTSGANSTRVINSSFSHMSRGIYINIVNNTLLERNTFSKIYEGVYQIGGSSLTNISYNNFSYNPMASNIVAGNILAEYNLFEKCGVDMSYENKDISGNTFFDGSEPSMLSVSFSNRTPDLNSWVLFNISFYYPNGTACTSFTNNNYMRPSQAINSTTSGNNITGNFTFKTEGVHSFIVNLTDSDGNWVNRKYLFFVESDQTKTTNYYIRPDALPQNGQPKGTDSKALLLETPGGESNFTCSVWIQASPDNVSSTPLGFINDINISHWYSSEDAIGTTVGVERYVEFSSNMDNQQSIPTSPLGYTWNVTNFTQLNWATDYPKDWYWLAIKIGGDNPTWYTNQTHPSYVNVSYLYSDKPEIKRITSENATLLSATSLPTDEDNATIYLEGTGDTNVTVQMPNAYAYNATYDGVNCGDTASCAVSQLSGELEFEVSLGSEHNITIYKSDGTAPKYWDNSTNSTYAGQPVEFSLRWTDSALSGYVFSLDNCTGSFANVTGGSLTGTEDWSNVTQTINSTAGCTIRWKVYANDTSNNWNVSEEYSFVTTQSCTVAMGFSINLLNGVQFGSVDPSNELVNASQNNGTGVTNYSVQVLIGSGCSPDTGNLWTNVNQSFNTTDQKSIPYTNYYYSYNETDGTVPGSSRTSYSTDYQAAGDYMNNGSYSYLKFYINVTSDAQPGTYKSYTFFKLNLTS